jgi:hypothetical protein
MTEKNTVSMADRLLVVVLTLWCLISTFMGIRNVMRENGGEATDNLVTAVLLAWAVVYLVARFKKRSSG